MAESLVLVLVLGLVVGGMTLMLAVGYTSIEKDRKRQQQARVLEAVSGVERLVAVPGFFDASPRPTPIAFVFDDGVVHRLEHHVRIEQAAVAQFVHHPSVDNLYRESGARLQLH